MPDLSQRPDARERGFTLIELLVVIVVVGVLAGVAVPVYLTQRKKAEDATLKRDLHAMLLAIRTYEAEHPQSTYIPPPPDHAGWSIVAKSTPNSHFSGNPVGGITGNIYPDGFDPPRLTPGTGMGVLYRADHRGQICIVANRRNSHHQVPYPRPEGTSYYDTALFYDSTVGGGPYTKSALPSGGICSGVYGFNP